MDPPAGKAMLPGLHYNPYFPGGAIAMAKQLTDGQVEYEDGTPGNVNLVKNKNNRSPELCNRYILYVDKLYIDLDDHKINKFNLYFNISIF